MYQVDEKGFFGKFGGAYVPEILYKCVTELQQAYKPIIESEEFKKEYRALLKDYVGRPSPLYYAKRMSEKYGCQLYLKREDLNHTGAHKINNTIGQILMAKKMGKTRIIAETGAGQHGVATATVCALMNMKCEIFMGATDVERQHTNVERMKMLGAKVNPVRTGNMTLSDACSERMVEVLGQIIEEDKDLELVGKAHNGEEICNIIREKEPDVVVLDIIRPKMDGLAVMEKFAHDKSLKKAPVFIVVSAVGQERITEDAFSLGADYYILKPFDNKMLLNRIKHARRAGERRMREISRQTERTEEKQVPVRNLETDSCHKTIP